MRTNESQRPARSAEPEGDTGEGGKERNGRVARGYQDAVTSCASR